MDVQAIYGISNFADLGNGDAFIGRVDETMKYCIKTFDQFEGGRDRTRFTVLGALDYKPDELAFKVLDERLLQTTAVLAVRACELALSENGEDYSFERTFEHELGVIFISAGQRHLAVRIEDGADRLLLNLATGELTQGPEDDNLVVVRKWTYQRPQAADMNVLLTFHAER